MASNETDVISEIVLLLRARTGLIVLVTAEEVRSIRAIHEACKQTGQALAAWDCAAGFQSIQGQLQLQQKTAVGEALKVMEEVQEPSVFVLCDFHHHWDNPVCQRRLKTLAQRFHYQRKNVIVIRSAQEDGVDVPAALRNVSTRLVVPPPAAPELTAILNQLLQMPGVKNQLSPAKQKELVREVSGLSASQAEQFFCRAIVSDGVLDVRDLEFLREQRIQQCQSSESLRIISTNKSLDEIGGMAGLKKWLDLRKPAFEPHGEAYGLQAPRGILLAGLPGSGKSLAASVVANIFEVPLLRFSFGALLTRWFGESERNLQVAMRQIERFAPCVLWIDEIEKVFRKTVASTDETTSRMLADVLTWLQDRKETVFVVATVNELTKLPAELTRRGRFDVTFFVDLPTANEREEIIAIHLRRRGKDPARFELSLLAQQCAGHVGAEIESAIVDAMFSAYNDPGTPFRELETDDIAAAMGVLIPLSKSHRDQIVYLQESVKNGRAVSVSDAEIWRGRRAFALH